MRRAYRSVIRTTAFLRKEIVEVVRQPRLVAVVVVGPFLILLVFGGGLRETDPALRTRFVVPEDSPVAAEVVRFAEAQDERLQLEGVTTDRGAALAELEAGALDLVVVVPDDILGSLRRDEQADVVAYHAQLDPLEAQAIHLFTRTAVDEINQLVLRQFVAETQRDAGAVAERVERARTSLAAAGDDPGVERLAVARADLAALAVVAAPTIALLEELGATGDTELLAALNRLRDGAATLDAASGPESVAALRSAVDRVDAALQRFRSLSPGTIVSPFDGTAELVVDDDIALVDFYAPAVVVLLLQHLVATFVALSLVREQALGTTELFKVSPMGAGETLVGKCLAYLLLGGVIAGVLLAGMRYGLGVPLAGPFWALATVVGLLLAVSIAYGFLMALRARSDSQAVQYAMLLLLASIFLSGFILSLERFRDFVSWVALPIPARPAIDALRDVMLRGTLPATSAWLHLGGLTLVAFVLAFILLRRRLRTG